MPQTPPPKLTLAQAIEEGCAASLKAEDKIEVVYLGDSELYFYDGALSLINDDEGRTVTFDPSTVHIFMKDS